MKVEAEVEMTPQLLASVFADWNDEDQAQFFIEVAAVAASWTASNCPQWYMVGRHLSTCSCSNDDARDLVLEIAAGIRPPPSQRAE